MSGTKEGGIKARDMQLQKYGKDWYSKIGKIGGKLGNTGGFYKNPVAASKAGYKGGIVTGEKYKTRRKDATV